MKYAAFVGIVNYIILILCELTAQSLSPDVSVIVRHGATLFAAVICVGVAEIILTTISKNKTCNKHLQFRQEVKRKKIIENTFIKFWWWPFTVFLISLTLFRSTIIMLSWQQSAIPYGNFAAIYLMIRTLLVWRRNQSLTENECE